MRADGFLIVVFAAALSGALADTLWPSSQIAAVTGNGRLTVGVADGGRINSFRWPSPGYWDQLYYCPASGRAPESQGAGWGVHVDGAVTWVDDLFPSFATGPETGDSVIVTSTSEVQGNLSCAVTSFVDSQSDVFVSHLALKGLAQPPRFYWYANFAPCTRQIPQLPIADWLLDDRNDFAAQIDSGAYPLRVWHYRPDVVTAEDWTDCPKKTLRGVGTRPAYGVWIAYACLEEVTAFQCGREGGADSACTQVLAGALQGNTAACGQCDSALEIVPGVQGDTFSATVYVAVGKTPESAARQLDAALADGYDVILRRTREYWRQWLGAARLPGRDNVDAAGLASQCLLALALATDADTGAVVESPVTCPPAAIDRPRDGIWSIMAYDLVGLHEKAGQHLDFYLNAVRTDYRPGCPLGSLPEALYTNGDEASPELLVDLEGAARTLWVVGWHAGQLEVDERADFWAGHWPRFERLVDFVSGWKDQRDSMPFPAFDSSRWCDASTTDLLLVVHAGMSAAVQAAGLLGKDRPQWEERLSELQTLVLLRCVSATGTWNHGRVGLFRPEQLVPDNDPGWIRLLNDRVKELPDLQGRDAVQALFELAVAWQDDETGRNHLRPHVIPVVRRVLASGDSPGALPASIDSRVAAMALCAMALCAEDRSYAE